MCTARGERFARFNPEGSAHAPFRRGLQFIPRKFANAAMALGPPGARALGDEEGGENKQESERWTERPRCH